MQERRAAIGNCGLFGISKVKQQLARVEPSLLQAYSALCPVIPMAALCTLVSPGEAVASWEGMALAFADTFPPPPG